MYTLARCLDDCVLRLSENGVLVGINVIIGARRTQVRASLFRAFRRDADARDKLHIIHLMQI
jgi:hypothetical protein